MHWQSQIERDFMGAWDVLDDHGKPREQTLKIKSAKGEKLKTKQTPNGKGKLVIRFHGADKGFVCNKTNGLIIEQLYGSELENWIGKLITLYPARTRDPGGGSEPIPCIRVRPKVPSGAAEAPGAGRPVDPKLRGEQDAAFGRQQQGREPGGEG